jgi:Domain of unknown function (DUF4397)
MNRRRTVVRRPRFFLAAIVLVFLAGSCDDNTPTSDGSSTTTTTAPSSSPSGSAFLRAAQLAFDGRTVDVVVNSQEMARTVAYPGVSGYAELDPGEYRVQFFPTGSRRAVLAETTLTLSAGEEATVALVGLSSLDIVVLDDERAAPSANARVKLVNAIPDFPTSIDAAVRNGPILFQNVGYLESTGLAELVPGVYDIEARRTGTGESLAAATGSDFRAGTSYTLFATGSLRRGDMKIVVASDAT